MQKNWRIVLSILCALALMASLTGCPEWRNKRLQIKIAAGDDGFVTAGGGGTEIDLSSLPLQNIFGAPATGSTKVSLKGQPLSRELGDVDTIIQRPRNMVLTANAIKGELVIRALNLVSEQPVSIGDKRYQLQVGLSTAKSETGQVTLNRDGKFTSSLPVTPRLVFTPEGGGQPVVIDCGEVPCMPGGKAFVLVSEGASWSVTPGLSTSGTAVSVAFRESHSILRHLPTLLVQVRPGILVGGGGWPEYKTNGSTGFAPGVVAGH
jgi:hypothetical protein